MIILIDFLVNVYPGFKEPAWTIKDPDDLAEQSQADSVRIVLERFARQAITPDEPSRAAYADSFTDDEDIRGERVLNLLDQPDLSGMSEVEMHEFIDANTELKHISDFNKPKEEQSSPAADPPPSASQSSHQAETQPAE